MFKISAIQTMKIFFHSKKLMLRSLVILVNWLTNTLVYYGISFNTSELFGDPYLNFTLSIVLELFAILVSHYTLQKFGRKIPYSINMALSGVSLILVMFIPTSKFLFRYFSVGFFDVVLIIYRTFCSFSKTRLSW